MPKSSAVVTTEHASKYLQQLCKHWSHKMETEFNAEVGKIRFPAGSDVQLSASSSELSIVIEDPDADTVQRLEGVVADHLQRFAFREELVFSWTNQ